MISLLLKEVVEKKSLYVRNNTSLRNLIELMNKNQKGVVVVLDGKRPVGILTERDMVEILFNGIDLEEKADRYAKKTLITTKGDRTIGYALNLMIDNNIRRMIVVDDGGNFLGVITQTDMLKHLEDDFYRATIKIKHILDVLRPLVSASPHDSIRDILKVMVKHKISAIPLIEGEKAAGIVTEKDILRLAGKNVSLEKSVGRYMSKPVITAHPDKALVDVVKIMNKHSIRRVVIKEGKGKAAGIVTIRDILKNLEGDYSELLERKLRHTKDVMNLFPEMIIEVSDTRKEYLVVWANEKVLEKFGRRILDQPITELVPRKTWEKISTNLLASYKVEEVRFKKGSNVYELSGFFIKTDGKTERGRIQLVIRDITEDIKLSTTDPLTGLYNRRFTNEFLIKEIERCKRHHNKFSLAIADLDDFKQLNDTYGHPAGDVVLKSVARLLEENLRKADIVGRYGGEEFLLIMPETIKHFAVEVVAERLRAKIGAETIALSKRRKATVTASFGIAAYPEDGSSLDDLLIAADDRLYKAKREGKNKVIGE